MYKITTKSRGAEKQFYKFLNENKFFYLWASLFFTFIRDALSMSP